jgi:hypothetical protein
MQGLNLDAEAVTASRFRRCKSGHRGQCNCAEKNQRRGLRGTVRKLTPGTRLVCHALTISLADSTLRKPSLQIPVQRRATRKGMPGDGYHAGELTILKRRERLTTCSAPILLFRTP